LNFPNGLAISDGNLYVGNGGSSTIDQISLSTGLFTTPTFATGLSNPNGLATEGGSLFEMNTGTNSILAFSSTGTPLAPVVSDDTTYMNNSKGLAIDSEGDFYVTDEGDNSVTEYYPNGTFKAVFSTGFSGPNYITTMTLVVPATYALLTAGLGMLFVMCRRKKALV